MVIYKDERKINYNGSSQSVRLTKFFKLIDVSMDDKYVNVRVDLDQKGNKVIVIEKSNFK